MANGPDKPRWAHKAVTWQQRPLPVQLCTGLEVFLTPLGLSEPGSADLTAPGPEQGRSCCARILVCALCALTHEP